MFSGLFRLQCDPLFKKSLVTVEGRMCVMATCAVVFCAVLGCVGRSIGLVLTCLVERWCRFCACVHSTACNQML